MKFNTVSAVQLSLAEMGSLNARTLHCLSLLLAHLQDGSDFTQPAVYFGGGRDPVCFETNKSVLKIPVPLDGVPSMRGD